MSHHKRAKVTVDAYVYETSSGQLYVSTDGSLSGLFGSLGSYSDGCPAGTVTVEWAEPDVTFEDGTVVFREGADPITRDHNGTWWMSGGIQSVADDATVLDGVRYGGHRMFSPNGEQVSA